MTFYNRFEQLCNIIGKVPSVVAKECGLSSGAPNTWKGNDKKAPTIPSINVAKVLADYFHVTTDYLISGIDTDTTLPNDEQELLKYYRLYKNDVGEKAALKDFKSVLPIKKLRCYKDRVSAGTGIDLESSISKPIQVYGNEEADGADFAVVVEGESMSPKFHDGDILAVRSIDRTSIETGEIGIFVVNEDKGFVKMLGDDRLISLNPDPKYEDIYFKNNISFRCVGVVLGTVVPL